MKCTYFIWLFAFLSFQTKAQTAFTQKKYQQFFAKNHCVVVVFLEPDCPISQKVTPTLTHLADSLHGKVVFFGVFPSKYPDKKIIKAFLSKYHVNFEWVIDAKQQLTQQLNASITPEVFVLNKKHEILYQGMINNQFYALGKNRKVATEHYLKDAINDFLLNKPVKTPKTQAVGCDISIFN